MTELDIEHSRRRRTSATRYGLQDLTRRFLNDTSGSTVIEYGLIMAMIFLAIVAATRYFADQTGAMYKYISAGLAKAS
ncbi:Flp family type IVb pilin [Methylobacterium sp. M6A4_1b]